MIGSKPLSIRPAPEPQSISGSRVPVVFDRGSLARLGGLVQSIGGRRVLLVSDPGIRDAGHTERAVRSLYHAGIVCRVFDEVGENPTTIHVGRGVLAARPFEPDVIVGLGGGSAMDCAKGINFILTNGGKMPDYWGTNKAEKPMLPLVAIPTTAGTGSEAQSFALITDPDTHQKMACGDDKALPRLAILDADLTATTPAKVAAATGIDAIAHAVETAGTTRRNDVSRSLSKQAWSLLESAFPQVMADPTDAGARQDMLLGAHLAGVAIQNSMLGAAHALANPLTAMAGIPHGVAVGLMLPHVVRFNSADASPYVDLAEGGDDLADRLERLLDAGGLPRSLGEAGVNRGILERMADNAAEQWTARFNPRPVQSDELLTLYRAAF